MEPASIEELLLEQPGLKERRQLLFELYHYTDREMPEHYLLTFTEYVRLARYYGMDG